MSKILTLIIFFSVFLGFLLPAKTYADNVPFVPREEKVLPGSSRYLVKRFGEKIKMSLLFSRGSKIFFQKTLLTRRISELYSLVETQNKSGIERASQRVSFEAGVLKTKVQGSPEKDKNETLELFAKYKPLLESLRDHFPANSTFWLSIQQNIDTLNILAQELK